MKHIFLLLILSMALAPASYAAGFKTLSKDTTSWDGSPIIYPEGKQEITAIEVMLKPGEQLPFHCHPFNTVGYITAGEIEVEKLNGEKHRFAKGDTIVEVANTWHRGINHSKTETAALVGFYIGVKDVPTTVMMTQENKHICQ